MAVDWGEKHIGLALSDPTQTLAQPLTALTRRAGRRFPLRAFRTLVEEHRPTGVLVGLPLESSGAEGPAARQAQELAELIRRHTALPVALHDERMTTARALRAVADLGGRPRARPESVDALAATVLLQAYLDIRAG